MSASAVGVAAAVAVGAMFVVSSVAKLARPDQWRADAGNLGVARPVSAAVPFVEVALGALLVTQVARHAMGWVAVALLAVFTGFLGVRISQGTDAPCACFGSLSRKRIGAGQLVRNALFIAVAVMAAVL